MATLADTTRGVKEKVADLFTEITKNNIRQSYADAACGFYSRHYIGMDVNVSFEALEKKSSANALGYKMYLQLL